MFTVVLNDKLFMYLGIYVELQGSGSITMVLFSTFFLGVILALHVTFDFLKI